MYARPPSHPPALGEGVTGPSLSYATPYNPDRPPAQEALVPECGGRAFLVDPKACSDPITRTQQPFVTGTSVLGVKYKDGIMIATDCLGSYGSTKRYKDLARVKEINRRCVIACSGEISDFQQIIKFLDSLVMLDRVSDDGIELEPSEVFGYLQKVLYNRRNKFDPLWNTVVVGGVQHDGAPFLGLVGMIGTNYSDSHVTSGFGNHLARPLFRNQQKDDMDAASAEQLLKDGLAACFYRDKMSMNKFQVAKVTSAGVEISDPFAVNLEWGYQAYVNPTVFAVGAW